MARRCSKVLATQVLDLARARHDQWLQSTPAQRATLEPAYILGDRKHIPEAPSAVKSVLRTELLEVTPKTLAEACMRHGYCTAELIVWYVMKQLILPPDINEVTMQKEILTPPRISPSTLDQASAWLEEIQHRLNLCIKTKQNVHPRTIVAFVNETLSGITQYYRTVGNAWDNLYAKHQMRESNITLDRVYTMLAEFLIELKLHGEQDNVLLRLSLVPAALSSTPCMMSTSMPAKERSRPREKGSKEMVKVASPIGVLHAKTIGNQAVAHKDIIVQSIIQGDSQADVLFVALLARLDAHVLSSLKPRNAEWDETTWQQEEVEWQESQWETEEYEASKGKKGKGKGSKSKREVQGQECTTVCYTSTGTISIFERRQIPTQSQTRSTLMYDK